MAVTSIKTTYSLDVETVEKLEELARRWKVSKSEALRRAIRAATKLAPPGSEDAIRALDELQQSLDVSKDLARRWEKRTRDERRGSARRLEFSTPRNEETYERRAPGDSAPSHAPTAARGRASNT